jgi:hypothetical protein
LTLKAEESTNLSKEVLSGFAELDDQTVDERLSRHVTLACNGVLLTTQTLKALGTRLQHLNMTTQRDCKKYSRHRSTLNKIIQKKVSNVIVNVQMVLHVYGIISNQSCESVVTSVEGVTSVMLDRMIVLFCTYLLKFTTV